MKQKFMVGILLATSMLFAFSGMAQAGDAAAGEEKILCVLVAMVFQAIKLHFQKHIVSLKLAVSTLSI